MKEYTEAAYEFGVKYKPIFNSAPLVFPVVASMHFEEEIKSFVVDFMNKSLKGGNWHVKHPVLVELETGIVFHCAKESFLGGGPISVAIDFAKKYFTP